MVIRHAFEKPPHCHRGDQPCHLTAQAEVLAGAKAEMPLRPPIDGVDIRVGNFRRSRFPDPNAKATLSPTRRVSPCRATSRVTVRLKRCADVLNRSDSSIAGSISAGSATMRRRASG